MPDGDYRTEYFMAMHGEADQSMMRDDVLLSVSSHLSVPAGAATKTLTSGSVTAAWSTRDWAGDAVHTTLRWGQGGATFELSIVSFDRGDAPNEKALARLLAAVRYAEP